MIQERERKRDENEEKFGKSDSEGSKIELTSLQVTEKVRN
jgi:hypothetical protein